MGGGEWMKGRGCTKNRLHRNGATYSCLQHCPHLPVDKGTSTGPPPPPQMLCLPRLTILFSNPNLGGEPHLYSIPLQPLAADAFVWAVEC